MADREHVRSADDRVGVNPITDQNGKDQNGLAPANKSRPGRVGQMRMVWGVAGSILIALTSLAACTDRGTEPGRV
jgi:hypothetical protein